MQVDQPRERMRKGRPLVVSLRRKLEDAITADDDLQARAAAVDGLCV